MKTLVRTNHNKAEEVITRAEEELVLAKLIRRGADRDLVRSSMFSALLLLAGMLRRLFSHFAFCFGC